MYESEFYDYIMENYNLGGTASRPVHNIIWYVKWHVKAKGLANKGESHAHLKVLLGGAFGIEEHEIELYSPSKLEED